MNRQNYQIHPSSPNPLRATKPVFLRGAKPAALALAASLALAQMAGAASYTWNVSSGNWSSAGSWTAGGPPLAADSAVFGGADTSASSSTVNNTVDAGFLNSITGLTYNSISITPEYNVTLIPTGQTLSVTGNVLIGGQNEGAGGYSTYAFMTGGGTFEVTGSSAGSDFIVQNYGSASGANACAFLNLTNLNTFIYNNSLGTISIEDDPGSLTRLGGSVWLALTNTITAANINLGTSTSAQAGPSGGNFALLTLGANTNIFNIGTLTIGTQKSTYVVTNAGGGLRLRDASGGNTAVITVGSRNVSGGSGTTSGSLLLNGCPVNIACASLTIGESPLSAGPSTTEAGVGLMQFDTGIVSATSVSLGYDITTATTAPATGTLSVGANATLAVGTGGLSLVNQTSTAVGTGTLNVAAGGTVTCAGDITEGTTSGTGNLNLGGTLSLAENSFAGTTALPINNLTLSNNATVVLASPSTSQANLAAGALNWPSPDTGVTFQIGTLPLTTMVGTTIPLIAYTSISGSVVAPVVSLQTGFAGTVSQIGNVVTLTITTTPPPPTMPQNVTATPGNAEVGLSWHASTGSAGPITYDIGLSTNSGGEVIIATGVSATNYTVTGLLNEVPYYFVIYAVNEAVASAASSEVTTTPVGPPQVPTDVSGSLNGAGKVLVNWNDANATSYNILRATSPSGPYTQIATGVTGTSYTDTTVVPGTTLYYYEVVAVNGSYDSAASSPDTVPYGQGNQLVNPGFEDAAGTNGWTLVNNAIGNVSVTSTVATPAPTYDNSTNGECAHDAVTNLVVTHSGTNVGKLYGGFDSYPNLSGFSQVLPAAPGGTWAGGAWTYASHEDLSGDNSFYYEVDFLNVSGTLIASYESYDVKDLTCGETTPFPLDTWVFLDVTNEMQVTSGVNTGTVIGNTTSGVLTAPAGTASVRFQAVFDQVADIGGSIYVDDAELDLINGQQPPILSDLPPVDGLTLCTNTALSTTAVTSSNTITVTNVEVIVQSSTLGGTVTTVTNGIGSPFLTVTGLGTSTATIKYALTPNLFYDLTIVATDSNGNSGSVNANFDTLSPVLVIEASDFNYSSGEFVNTPANGGVDLFANQVGTQGVDENKSAPVTRDATKNPYRTNDAVVIQGAGSTSYTEQKFFTALANGNSNAVELEVGYNSVGDWLDYTRSYGSAATNSAPAGDYNVWMYSGTSGSGTQSSLYQVTSNPTLGNQTSNFLGSFGTSAYANDAYANFEYLPLVDASGNLVAVTLSGTETLCSVVVGNPNIGFYMLTPAESPTLESIYPNGPFGGTNVFTFTVTPNDGPGINTSGISVLLNGVNVTAGLTFTQEGGNWLVSAPILPNTIYSAIINVTNTGGVSISSTNNFDSFSINNFQWEAVDYDFSELSADDTTEISGMFIDNPVPTCDVNTYASGELATNSYFGYPTGFNPGVDPNNQGAVAEQGIDINFPNDGQSVTSEYYRADGVGSQPATDYVRPKFIAAQQEFGDPNIGPINIGYYGAGYWLNYTRHYPTNSFYVWGRMAGGGPWANTTLSVVTSGVGTANQVLNLVGTFADPTANGYQSWHWVQMMNNGVPAILSLGGQETLRVTSGGGLNTEYFMLVPAPLMFTVTPSIVSGQLNLSFPTAIGYTYQLLYKSALSSPSWTQVGSSITGNGSTYSVNKSLSGAQGFYEVSAQQN